MVDVSTRLVVESAKREAADLRALLRYLYLAGWLEADLGTAMPPVAVWRGASLPRAMQPAKVDGLIASCDRSSRSGRRDRAVLTLMARRIAGWRGCRDGASGHRLAGGRDHRAWQGTTEGSTAPPERGRRGARRVSGRWPTVVCDPAPGCSLCTRRSGGSLRARSRTSSIGPVPARASTASADTGCATLWPPKCCAKAATCSRSPRCCASRTSAPRLAMPRSIAPLCEWSPAPGRGRGHERARRAPGGVSASAPRALGHQLADAARLLPRFVALSRRRRRVDDHVEAALAWVQQPEAGPSSSVWVRRMGAVRGFARYMSGRRPGQRDPAAWAGELPATVASAVHLLRSRHPRLDGRGSPAHPHAFPGGHVHDDDRPAGRDRHAIGEVIALAVLTSTGTRA